MSDAPVFHKPRLVTGHRLQFRDASVEDAEFILSLRLDPAKNQHLSATSPDREAQEQWLRRYAQDEEQVYFIIEDRAGKRVGTVRLYDRRGPSFCWGSWILSDQAPQSSAVESTLMVYSFALELGFTRSHFDVRKANEKVWHYHERLGATRVAEDEDTYYYEIGEDEVRGLLERYSERVPQGVSIEW